MGGGLIPRVREGVGKGVTGDAPPNPARRGLRGVGVERRQDRGGGNEIRAYKMVFLTRAGPRPCPAEGCSGRALTQRSMRVHFWYRHFRYTVVILEEGNLPHPW